MMKRKLLALSLTLVLALALCACGGSAKVQDGYFLCLFEYIKN